MHRCVDPGSTPGAPKGITPASCDPGWTRCTECVLCLQVIPPEGWTVPFAIDRDSLRFKTRIQSVHELQQRADLAAASESFHRGFQAWLRSQGKSLRRSPVVAGQDVDLAKLYRLVTRRGGFERVTDKKLWRDVARIMQVSCLWHGARTLSHGADCMLTSLVAAQVEEKASNAMHTLRQIYQKHLLPYEAYSQQRMDPVPAGKSKGKRTASNAAPSRFDAMLAVADDAAEAAEILGNLMSMDSAGAVEDPPLKRHKSHKLALEVPLVSSLVSGMPLHSRRTLPADLPAHLAQDQAAPKAEKIRVPSNIYELNCELCKGGHHEDKIILCDQCDRGCHLFCLNPPLEEVPQGHWVCPLCREAEAAGGAFKEGHEYTLPEFERVANEFKTRWFGEGQQVCAHTPMQHVCGPCVIVS